MKVPNRASLVAASSSTNKKLRFFRRVASNPASEAGLLVGCGWILYITT